MRNSLEELLNNIQGRLADLDRKPAWLAEKSGIAKAVLSRLLSGENSPSLATVDSIAKGFGCESWELLKPAANPIEAKVSRLFDQLMALESELSDVRIKDADLLAAHNRDYEDYSMELTTSAEEQEDLEAKIALIKNEIFRLERSYPEAVRSKEKTPLIARTAGAKQELLALITSNDIDDGLAEILLSTLRSGIVDKTQAGSGS